MPMFYPDLRIRSGVSSYPCLGMMISLAYLTIGAAGCVREPTPTPSGPELQVTPPSLVYRLTDGGPDVRIAMLELHNAGPGPLRILGVETFCGCIVVTDIPKESISIGGKATLTLQLTIPGSGSKTAIIAIDYSARQAGRITVPIELHGKPPDLPYLLSGETGISLRIPDGQPSARRRVRFETREAAERPPWIMGLRSSVPWLEVTLPDEPEAVPADAGQVTRYYDLEIAASPAPGEADGRAVEIEWMTDQSIAKRPPNLRVTILQTTAIKAIPPRLMIPRDDQASTPIARQLALIANGSESWEMRTADNLPPGCTVNIVSTKHHPDQTVAIYQVTIDVPNCRRLSKATSFRSWSVVILTTTSMFPSSWSIRIDDELDDSIQGGGAASGAF
jgi:hypothetical protein